MVCLPYQILVQSDNKNEEFDDEEQKKTLRAIWGNLNVDWVLDESRELVLIFLAEMFTLGLFRTSVFLGDAR